MNRNEKYLNTLKVCGIIDSINERYLDRIKNSNRDFTKEIQIISEKYYALKYYFIDVLGMYLGVYNRDDDTKLMLESLIDLLKDRDKAIGENKNYILANQIIRDMRELRNLEYINDRIIHGRIIEKYGYKTIKLDDTVYEIVKDKDSIYYSLRNSNTSKIDYRHINIIVIKKNGSIDFDRVVNKNDIITLISDHLTDNDYKLIIVLDRNDIYG